MIRKRGKSYQVRVAPFAARTVYTREAANKLEADLKNRKALGDLAEVVPHTLEEEINEFSDRRDATNTYRPATALGHRALERSWGPLHKVLVPALNRQVVEDEFIRRAKTAPVQADKELKFLKACLRDAALRGQRVDQTIFTIKYINKKPRRGRALTVEQLAYLGSWLPDHLTRLPSLAAMVGARQSVWFQMTDDLLDLEAGTLNLPAELQKNGRDLVVFLSVKELQLFREQLLVRAPGSRLLFPSSKGGRYSRHNFRKVWVHAIEKAAEKDRERTGLTDSVYDGFTFHMLRHTCASLMAFAGIEPPVAAERLGHTDGGALYLKTYRHLMEGERKRAAERFGEFLAAEYDLKDGAKERTSDGSA